MRDLDVQRIKELINGDEPTSPEENFFILGLEWARDGQLLGDLLLKEAEQIENATPDMLIYMMLGYGTGQKEIWTEIAGDPGNNNFH